MRTSNRRFHCRVPLKIKALIFDFDGLILDTETPEVNVWSEIYSRHGFELPFDEWAKTIGGYGISSFDAAEHLVNLTGGQLDAASLRADYRAQADSIIHTTPVMPGVMETVEEAKRLGLRLAVASSSPHSWVDSHLARLGLLRHFDKIVCSDDVPPGRTKPNPDLFLKVLDELQIAPREAIVFEDSPNGVRAANRAGVFVVAVPNPLTSRLGIEGENLSLRSLADLPLASLLARFEVD